MKKRVVSLGSAISAAVALASPAPAQTLVRPYNAGDALRESELARRENPTPQKPLPQLPEFAEPRLSIPGNERLLVRRFNVEAPAGLVSPEETHEAVARFENRKLTLSEIYDAADQITNLYRSHGYIVAKAYVPQQDARSGTLRIKLIAGSRAGVALQNNSLIDLDFLKGVIDNALILSPFIHKDELERAMLLISDMPGAGTPRIAVSPGKQPETTDLTFIAPEAPRVEGYILGENYGSPYTGRLRMSGSLAVNSPLGYGDRLSLFGMLSEQTELANWRAAYAFPIGLDGMRAEISAFQTTYVLGGLYKSADATGIANGASANVAYPIKRQRDESISLFSNFTHKYLDDKVLNTSTASRTIDLGTLGITRSTFGALLDMPLVTESSLSATAGYVTFPDPAERAANVAGVDTAGSYARLNFNLNATLALSQSLSLSTSLRAQKSLGRNLDASEKLEVTGYYGVRSYDEGLAGDSGYVVTPELKYALPEIERYHHSAGLFMDVGAAWLEHGAYTTTQKAYTPLSDFGAGYYATYQFSPTQSIFLKAQVAHSFGSEVVAPTYDRHTKGLVQIGLSAASEPTHGGLFTAAPAPDLGASLAALLPDTLEPPTAPQAPESPVMPSAPIGVFGADMPSAGRLVFSVVPSFINNSHSLIGREYYSPQSIVAKIPWYWNQSLTVRTVPNDLFAQQQTLTFDYGLTKDVTLLLSSGFVEKHSHMMTFTGAADLNQPVSNLFARGMSFPGTDSITDTTIAGIWRFYEDPVHRLQLNLGLSLPTASNHNPGTLLQTNGSYATTRAFYGMQSGTGTFDIMPGLVYRGALENWSWGLSYRARLPLAVNPEGYAWGDLHEFNAWGGYTWIPGVTTTLRLAGTLQGSIIGADPLIYGKVQSADPNFYGGQRAEVFAGATIGGALFGMPAFDIALEGGVPVYENLNGPQLAKNWQANMKLRYRVGKEDRSTLPFGLASLFPDSPELQSDARGPRWTGFHIGVNGGANFGGNTSLNTTPGPIETVENRTALIAAGYAATVSNSSLTLKNNGFLGGVHIGYDWRLGKSFVGGFEADIDGVSGSTGYGNQALSAGNWPYAATGSSNGYKALNYLSTVRARLGYLATPKLLLYGTGGLAMAGANLNTGVFVQETIGGISYPVSGSSLYTDLRAGFAAGLGAEWMFAPRWSAKLEYLYYDTGVAHPLGGVAVQQSTPALKAYVAPQPSYRFDGNIARIGLSYHFNGYQSAPAASPATSFTALATRAAARPLSSDKLWNGLYGGLNFGGGQSSGGGDTGYLLYADSSFPIGYVVNGLANLFLLPSGSQTGAETGLIGGGQLGYNYQLSSNFVIGAEADLQATSITSGKQGATNSVYPSPYGVLSYFDAAFNLYQTNGFMIPLTTSPGGVAVPWFGTARARAGFLPLSNLLVYGAAGMSYGQVTTYVAAGGRAGWNAGGGVEWMFTPDWSVKAEYLHVDFSRGGAADPSFWLSGDHSHPQVNIARAGLNYHFNWDAPALVDERW